jgi:hypothetical protein
MIGSFFSTYYWQISWPFFVLWVLLFFTFNFFYFTNRRLFLLLEKEDWPALVRYLEEIVIQRGRYSPWLVRLLANSYLLLSDSAAVMRLENKVAVVKPALVDENALVYGIAHILGKDISGGLIFFEARKDTVKAGMRDWMLWFYSFALLLNCQFEKSAQWFCVSVRESKDPVVCALSSFFLSKTIAALMPEKRDGLKEISSQGKKKVYRSLPKEKNWRSAVSRLSTEMHAAIISKYLDETCRWLYE